ncbi:bleomycin hydrolase [Coemansia guatemalensis]|uniref:Cysteine proteinase 1, mitochondrial n=1 Tax=Coemansia guatemalensis TaxID=2761395 RepID=A0A9W8HRT9_9FUNG|nr:bleomycin hydrolase [Coemansia guatemalensis]
MTNFRAKGPLNDSEEFSSLQLRSLDNELNADKTSNLARITVPDRSYADVLHNYDVQKQHPPVFSHELPFDGSITDQKDSGICWIFASLNVLRRGMMEKYNMEDLELSQPYLFYYDKLEKANWFLENILATLDQDIESPDVQGLLSSPNPDGGHWHMFVALIEKYGVVPKHVYPETFHTSHSSLELADLLGSRLREHAMIFRNAHAMGATVEDLRKRKHDVLKEIHRIVSISAKSPPERFTWIFKDKDGKLNEFKDITPLEFYKQHVSFDCSQTVGLMNDPRKEYMRSYQPDYIGNVVGAPRVIFINVPMSIIRQCALKSIKDGCAATFGLDGCKLYSRATGIRALDITEYEAAFDIKSNMSKAERLQYKIGGVDHIMTLIGVHIEDGQVIRWKAEDSSGGANDNNGYSTITDEWFEEHSYFLHVKKNYVPEHVLDVLDSDAVPIPYNHCLVGIPY